MSKYCQIWQNHRNTCWKYQIPENLFWVVSFTYSACPCIVCLVSCPLYSVFSLKNYLCLYFLGCHTKIGSGNYSDMPCVMTWTYPINGVTYTGCANPHNDPKGNWCPTLLNNDNEFESTAGKWGYCSDNCPIDDGK